MDFSSYFPIWSKLAEEQKRIIERNAVYRKAEKGEAIHNGSVHCTGLLLVASGQLRAYILSEEGREITVYRLFERDLCLFSAFCIMSGIRFEISIDAAKESEFWVIPAEVYKRLMEESAELANYTNEVMAERFSDVMWLMEQVLWKSFDRRLAEFLLKESEFEGTERLKMTHEEIGNHMGNPREVVTRMLRYFSSEGIVKLSRGVVEIADMNRLKALAE